MNYEIIFSFIQLIKFLTSYEMNIFDFFKENNYYEDTNTFSYIYLKFLILFNYIDFFKIIIINNSISSFKEKFIIDYIDNLKKLNLLKYLNYLIIILKKDIVNYCKYSNKYFCKNNRLSLFELNF